MPNFWTKTTQMIYEAFKGPRTIDIDFNGKYEEIKIMVSQIKNISVTIKSFPEKLNGFKQLCTEICQNLIKPYPNDCIYFSQINSITSAHQEMIKCYDECSAILGKLSGSTEEWHKTFNDVKINLKKREEARKIHDHYDEKMEKLIEEKHKKMENNQEETEEEIQKFDRVRIYSYNLYNLFLIFQNEAKYKRAVSDYVALSSNTYKLMEDLGGMRYKIINQMVKTFIEQEKKFFEKCYFLVNNFYKGMGIMDQTIPYPKTGYDPMKYIRAKKIMEGVDTNSLPNIKMKDKYSSNYTNNNSSNSNFNKKYSFEDYKLRKSSTIQNNNNNINNINTISNNNINNNIQNVEKPLNPYSYEAYKKRTQSLDTLKRGHQNNNNIFNFNNNSNNNANFYQSNLNLVMNSIINKDSIQQLNPFSNMNNEESNPYSINNNINNNKNILNPYNNNDININKKDDSDDMPNPYLSIFNPQNNNKNNNKVYNPYTGTYNYQQQNNNNNNDNSKKPPDKYNFGF